MKAVVKANWVLYSNHISLPLRSLKLKSFKGILSEEARKGFQLFGNASRI